MILVMRFPDDLEENGGSVLLHIARQKNYIQGPCFKEALHEKTQPLRVGVIQIRLENHDRLLIRFPPFLTCEEAQKIGSVCKVSASHAISHGLYNHVR